MRYTNRDYTDICVVVGPNHRWVQNSFGDLYDAYPEVFLGYRVLLFSHERAIEGTRGLRPIKKLVILHADYSPIHQMMIDGISSETWSHGGRVEEWHVHRGEGIYRIY